MISCAFCGGQNARLPKPEEKEQLDLMILIFKHLCKAPDADGIHARCLMDSYKYVSNRDKAKIFTT